MAISNKMANEQLREGYLNALTAYLEKEEQVLRVKSNEIAVPVVDANGDEKFIVITVKVPTGADKGREPYDGYAEAEDYAHKLREKAIKAEKKKAEKDQIKEVEEDIAKDIIPERPRTLTISSNGTNPFDPRNLEHITDKTLRQAKQEERMAQQARDIENLLDLRDI